MRERYDKSELEEIIENSFIIMDTNVLIDLYDLETNPIKEILEKLEGNIDKIWLPFQVYTEYYKHRERKIKDRTNKVRSLGSTICSEINHLTGGVNSVYNDNNITQQQLKVIGREFLQGLSQLEVELREKLQNYINQVGDRDEFINMEIDVIRNFVEQLHTQSNTKGFTGRELLEIFEEGEKRYQFSCPPGFTDKGKEKVNSKEKKTFDTYVRVFGDLIIWKEILGKVEGQEKNLIFIENEKKKDWLTEDAQRSVPKILMDEYYEASNGGKLFIVDLLEFSFYFKDYLEMSDDTFENVKNRYQGSNLLLS